MSCSMMVKGRLNASFASTYVPRINCLKSKDEIPKDFIDFILRYKALDLALKTENYIQANKYWNKFFKNNNVVSLNTNSCGCT